MTVDTATVVAALQAAKDVPGLEKAITDASFLDAIPGEDRQKLRGPAWGIIDPLNARSVDGGGRDASAAARRPRERAEGREVGLRAPRGREGRVEG